MLLVAFTKGIIKADKFALLYDINTSKKPPFPHDSYEEFSLDNFSDEECKAEFRVQESDLPVLADALGIPANFHCPRRSVVGEMEGLCMLLKRLAYPCRYSDMIPRFGRSVPEISMMTNVVLHWVYDEHGYHLTDFNQPFLSRASLQTYADVIHDKGVGYRTAGVSSMELFAPFADQAKIKESFTMGINECTPSSSNPL